MSEKPKGPDAYPRDHLIFLMGMVKGLCYDIRAGTTAEKLIKNAAYVETKIDGWLIELGMVDDNEEEKEG